MLRQWALWEQILTTTFSVSSIGAGTEEALKKKFFNSGEKWEESALSRHKGERVKGYWESKA